MLSAEAKPTVLLTTISRQSGDSPRSENADTIRFRHSTNMPYSTTVTTDDLQDAWIKLMEEHPESLDLEVYCHPRTTDTSGDTDAPRQSACSIKPLRPVVIFETILGEVKTRSLISCEQELVAFRLSLLSTKGHLEDDTPISPESRKESIRELTVGQVRTHASARFQQTIGQAMESLKGCRVFKKGYYDPDGEFVQVGASYTIEGDDIWAFVEDDYQTWLSEGFDEAEVHSMCGEWTIPKRAVTEDSENRDAKWTDTG